MRGPYTTIPELLGLVSRRAGPGLHFRALENERKFIGSQVAKGMWLHDMRFRLGQDFILVEVLAEPNSGGHALFVDHKNHLIDEPSHPDLELP
jgi:hypothetical protein